MASEASRYVASPMENTNVKDLRFKRVMRRDGRKIRLFRVMWEGPEVTRGGWLVSNKLSVALRPKLFASLREFDGWFVTIAGVEVHYRQSHGGRFA